MIWRRRQAPFFFACFRLSLRPVDIVETPSSGRDAALLPRPFLKWFAEKGWQPRAHQLELLSRATAGENMLLIAPTGAGKTLAGFLPSLTDLTRRGKIPPGSAFTGIHT